MFWHFRNKGEAISKPYTSLPTLNNFHFAAWTSCTRPLYRAQSPNPISGVYTKCHQSYPQQRVVMHAFDLPLSHHNMAALIAPKNYPKYCNRILTVVKYGIIRVAVGKSNAVVVAGIHT